MLQLLRLPVMVSLGFTLSACATMNVSSHVEQGLDFTQYHNWQWAPADALPATDARLDNPFFQDHFQGAVEKALSARHLNLTSIGGDAPDLLVHYHANIAPRMSIDQSIGACYDAACSVRVLDTDVSTIVLDVVDASTNRLIWRGWAQNPVEGVLDHPQRLESRISQAVTRMFARFPRSI